MLAAVNRLRTSGDFRRTVRQGRRAGGALVVVHLLTDAEQAATAPRVGFVVSKAVGTAVVRNRVKRRLRHLARERVDLLPAGTLVVVRAQPEAAAVSQAELGLALDRCLDRLLDGVMA